jgi:hypothetical protein
MKDCVVGLAHREMTNMYEVLVEKPRRKEAMKEM